MTDLDYASFHKEYSPPEMQRQLYDGLLQAKLLKKDEVDYGTFQSNFFPVEKKNPVGTASKPGSGGQPTAPAATPQSSESFDPASLLAPKKQEIPQYVAAPKKQDWGNAPGIQQPDTATSLGIEKSGAKGVVDPAFIKKTDNRIALSNVRDARRGDYTSDAVEIMERSLSERDKAELANKSLLDRTVDSEITFKQYQAQLSALRKDQTALSSGLDGIDQEISETIGDNAFDSYEKNIADYTAIKEKYDAAVKSNPQSANQYVDDLNDLQEEIEKFQQHPLVQERNQMVKAMQKNLSRFEGFGADDRYIGAIKLATDKMLIQSQVDNQDWMSDASGMVIRSFANLVAGTGRLVKDAGEMLIGNDGLLRMNEPIDPIANFLIDIGDSANYLFPSPSQYSRGLYTDTAKWGELQVDFKDDEIQAVRWPDGRVMNMQLTDEQTSEIKGLERRGQVNWSVAPYQAANVIVDMGVMLASADKVSKGLTALKVGEKTATRTGVALATAGQMSNGMYEQGMELFDGDKKKAAEYSFFGSLAIGAVQNVFGLEQRLLTGRALNNTSLAAAVGKMTPKQMGVEFAKMYVKEVTGETVEEGLIEPLATAAAQYTIGGKAELDPTEMVSNGAMGFIVSSLFVGGNMNLNEMQKSSLYNASKDPVAFGNALRAAVEKGTIKGDEDFVSQQVSRVSRIGEELSRLSPDLNQEQILDATAIIDEKIKAEARLKTAKGNEELEQRYQAEVDVLNEHLNKMMTPPTEEVAQKISENQAAENKTTAKTQNEPSVPKEVKVEKAVIEVNGKMYEGDNHAQAILNAKAAGEDISKMDRQRDGKFRLSDGTVIDRAEAMKRFGKDRSEMMIPQDEAADNANKEYREIQESVSDGTVGKEGEVLSTEPVSEPPQQETLPKPPATETNPTEPAPTHEPVTSFEVGKTYYDPNLDRNYTYVGEKDGMMLFDKQPKSKNEFLPNPRIDALRDSNFTKGLLQPVENQAIKVEPASPPTEGVESEKISAHQMSKEDYESLREKGEELLKHAQLMKFKYGDLKTAEKQGASKNDIEKWIEFVDFNNKYDTTFTHKAQLEYAIARGIPVSKEALGDSPELVGQIKKELLSGKLKKAVGDKHVGLNYLKSLLGNSGILKEYYADKEAGSRTELIISIESLFGGDPIGVNEADVTVPPTSPPSQPTTTEPTGDTVKKTVVTERAYEGDVRPEIKKYLKEKGLTRDVENQEIASNVAANMVKDLGVDKAVEAVRVKEVEGGVASAVLFEAMKTLDDQIAVSMDKAEIDFLAKKTADILAMTDDMGVTAGRFTAMFARKYMDSDIGWNANAKKAEYVEKFGSISPEVEARFEELESELKEVSRKLAEAEKRAKEAAEAATIETIKSEAEKKKPTKASISVAGKELAKKIRKGKLSRPGTFSAASPASIVWDTAIEIAATSIEAGSALAEAIQKGLNHIKASDWYKGLSSDKQRDAEQEYQDFLSEYQDAVGKLKIPKSLIRDLVAGGIDNVPDLVDAVRNELGLEGESDREIRDAITEYEKVINMTKDDIGKEVSRLKTIGKLITKIEDALNGIRPRKTGLQRPEYTEQQKAQIRDLEKQLREAMKGLPMDEETASGELKTALDTKKTRIRNRIEDLTNAINSKQKIVKSGKPIEDDAEVKMLTEERDRLQKIYEAVFSEKPMPLTDGEKRIASMEKQLDKLLAKDLPTTKDKPVYTKEEQDRIKQLRDEIFDAKVKAGLIPAKEMPIDPKEAEIQRSLDRLQKKLDDLLSGKFPEGSKEKRQATEKEKELRDQIAEQKALMGLIPSKRTQEQIKLDRLDDAISKTEELIKNNDLEFKKKENNQVTNNEIEARKSVLKESLDELKSLREQAGVLEKRRLEQTKARTKKSIADLERRIADRDFAKREKKPLLEDSELTQLRAEKLRIKEEYDKVFYIQELKNQSVWKVVGDVAAESWGIGRALNAGLDLSMVGVQGLILSLWDIKGAREAFRLAKKAAKSEEIATETLRKLKSLESYPLAKQSGLKLSEVTGKASAREELQFGSFVNYVWNAIAFAASIPTGLKSYNFFKKLNPFTGTERFGAIYLDVLRMNAFNNMLDGDLRGKSFSENKKDFQSVADAINTVSSRASLGPLEQMAPVLTHLIYSPRNWASQIKLFSPFYAPIYYARLTPTARKMIFMMMGKFIAFNLSTMALYAAYAASDDDDETSVEWDPRSSDFAKAKIGKIRADFWGGKIQHVTFFCRMMADLAYEADIGRGGFKNKKGEVLPLGMPHKTPGGDELLAMQIVNKQAPQARLLYNYWAKQRYDNGSVKDKYGGDYSFSEDAMETYTPMFLSTVIDLLKDGINVIDPAISFLSWLGMGTYMEEEKRKKTKEELKREKEIAKERKARLREKE